MRTNRKVLFLIAVAVSFLTYGCGKSDNSAELSVTATSSSVSADTSSIQKKWMSPEEQLDITNLSDAKISKNGTICHGPVNIVSDGADYRLLPDQLFPISWPYPACTCLGNRGISSGSCLLRCENANVQAGQIAAQTCSVLQQSYDLTLSHGVLHVCSDQDSTSCYDLTSDE